MAAQSRSSSPGRTPPFILVGLVVLVCFLAYNYWSLSSQNSVLMAELDTVRMKERDVVDENKQNKESLDAVRVELSKAKLSVESHRAQANQWGKEKGALNEQVAAKTTEVDSCKKSLETCNESQKTEAEAKVAIESEKEVLQNEIQALKDAPKTCEKSDCIGPIREVVVVAAKLTGTDALGNALAKAGLDAAALLDGINLPAPKAAEPEPKVAEAEPVQKGEEASTPQVNFENESAELIGSDQNEPAVAHQNVAPVLDVAQQDVAQQNVAPVLAQQDVAQQNAAPVLAEQDVNQQNIAPVAHNDVLQQNVAPDAPQFPAVAADENYAAQSEADKAPLESDKAQAEMNA